MHRIHSLLYVLLLVLLFSGCQSVEKTESVVNTVSLSPEPVITREIESVLKEEYSVGIAAINGNALSIENESFYSDVSGIPMIFITNGGTLSASGITLEKSVPSTSVQSENNALVSVDGNGTANISGSALTSDSSYADAVRLNGSGCSASLSDTVIVISGHDASGVAALNGSSVSADGCDFFCAGDSSCFYLKNGALAACRGCRISVSEDSEACALKCSNSSLSLVTCTVSGNLFFDGTENLLSFENVSANGNVRFYEAETAAEIRLTQNSLLKGATDGDGAIGISVSLDSSSVWSLTDDSYIAVLSDEDTTLSNIIGNGFNLYYNSENTENAWLNGSTLSLRNGGCLIPLI